MTDPVLGLHVASASVAIGAGFVALYTTKGASLHRRAGIVFVVTMIMMGVTAGIVSIMHDAKPLSMVPAGLLIACLVTSAFTAVRPPTPAMRRLDRAVFAIGAANVTFTFVRALLAVANGGSLEGTSAGSLVFFGGIGLVAVRKDLRVVREGPPTGVARIRRHVWRMGLALWIAAMSFFIGQADEFPAWLRIWPLLALPGVAIALTMVWWLRRLRARRRAPVPVLKEEAWSR